jgi:hypothetical protein
MMPATRQLLRDVASRYSVEPAEIIARCKPRRLLAARMEIAQELARRGYSGPRIGAIMKRDHTTVSYWLGRLSRQQPKPRPPPPPPASSKPLPALKQRRQIIRYAGWERS